MPNLIYKLSYGFTASFAAPLTTFAASSTKCSVQFSAQLTIILILHVLLAILRSIATIKVV